MRTKSFQVGDIVKYAPFGDTEIIGKIIKLEPKGQLCFATIQSETETRRVLFAGITMVKPLPTKSFPTPKGELSPKGKDLLNELKNRNSLTETTEQWLKAHAHNNEEILQLWLEEVPPTVRISLLDKRAKYLGEACLIKGLGRRKFEVSYSKSIFNKDFSKTLKEHFDNKKLNTETLRQLVRHEVGHLLTYELIEDKFPGEESFIENLDFIEKDLGITMADLNESNMNEYGRTDMWEAIAESYANPEFSEITSKIYNYIGGRHVMER